MRLARSARFDPIKDRLKESCCPKCGSKMRYSVDKEKSVFLIFGFQIAEGSYRTRNLHLNNEGA